MEQGKDSNIQVILEKLKHEEAKNDPKFILHDQVLYYLSNPDDDPTLRLYVPSHLKKILLVKQYHGADGHLELIKHIIASRGNITGRICLGICMITSLSAYRATKGFKKNRPPLKTTEIPPYPLAKVNLDISGPFSLSLSGNKYIASFIDNLTGYPEAFAIPDKSAETMVSLLLNDVFPRIGCPLVLVTDNGTENVNKNQLTGEVVSSHAEHQRLAKADWPNLTVAEQTKTLRKTRLTVVLEQTEDEIATEYKSLDDFHMNLGMIPGGCEFHSAVESDLAKRNNSDNQYVAQQNAEASEDPMSIGEANDDEGSTSDGDDNIPLSRLVRRAKRQRSDSSEEEDIPEFELGKRLKRREERLAELNSVIWV
ncbi:Pol polyprotein [Plakobranchus ocellatus]|uniref:Pol polyprotein n=1 Tax=Plakobranchus ocellatus TaxID=259542 RepID=A0AAV4DC39_9GAST|nr:Pol polyprotein [Plakobranchus ocellatus]